MISVVLYGRNDSHGYNLHKRAAISLNCIAEILTHPEDEILFVDYNTPDDMPTFVEAIQDTLTDRVKRLLRVLRVRPGQHQRFKARTHLVALEPISRNVAIRRANPANSWILSTNTDMVFVPRRPEAALSDIVADLPSGFYLLPRFDLPETLWEGLDRAKPREIIEAVRHWGRALHLNEVVYIDPAIRYDAPGDFQLMRRDDIFAINGFNEDMLLGWHVDSNLCKRMKLLRGRVDSLVDHLFGYHCDHTKVATMMHGADRIQNDFVEFVDNVTGSTVPAQAEAWGMADQDIEEIRLSKSNAAGPVYVRILEDLLGPMTQELYEAHHTPAAYNVMTYKAEHIFPYLLDQLVTLPRTATLGYVGLNHRTLGLLLEAWPALGFTGRVLIAKDTVVSALLARDARLAERLAAEHVVFADRDAIADLSQILLFDFGIEDDPAINEALKQDHGPIARADLLSILFETAPAVFLHAVGAERRRLAHGTARPRKFVAINAINTIFETLTQDCLWITITPFSTRIRHGYVKPNRVAELARRAEQREQAAARDRKVILDSLLTRSMPIELLSYRDASGFLTPAERDRVRAAAGRIKDDGQGGLAKVCLASLWSDSARSFADYLAYRPGVADQFAEHLALLAQACGFAGVRGWDPDRAAAINAAAAAYLGDAEARRNRDRHRRILAALRAVCRVGADEGDGLPSVERLLMVEHERMLGEADDVDVTAVRASFDFLLPALSRRAAGVSGQAEFRERLIQRTAAFLRRLRPPPVGRKAPAAQSGGRTRLGYLVDEAWSNPTDSRNRVLHSLLRGQAEAASGRIETHVYVTSGCDPAFLAQARAWGFVVYDVTATAGKADAPEALRQRLVDDRLDILVQESRGGLALALAEARVARLQVFLALDATLWEPEGVDVLALPATLRGTAYCDAATKPVLWFEQKIARHFIDRPVPAETLERARRRWAPRGETVLGMFGDLDQAGDAYLQTIARVVEQLPGTVCLFGGSGDGDHIRRFVAERKLENRFFLCGPDDSGLYARVLDVFLEPFPSGADMPALEAMASGTPVVHLSGAVTATALASRDPELAASDAHGYYAVARMLALDRVFREQARTRAAALAAAASDLTTAATAFEAALLARLAEAQMVDVGRP